MTFGILMVAYEVLSLIVLIFLIDKDVEDDDNEEDDTHNVLDDEDLETESKKKSPEKKLRIFFRIIACNYYFMSFFTFFEIH